MVADVFYDSNIWKLCCTFIVYSFVTSVVSGNASKVDQLWSITPVLYCWLVYTESQQSHQRLLLLCCLVSLWGARLTYNFWIKGGYGNLIKHEEDYRWPILRKLINNWWLFLLFNLTFIAAYQNMLLFLIAGPPAYEIKMQTSNITIGDLIVAAFFLLFLCLESLADTQHWQFQTLKHSLTAEQRGNKSNSLHHTLKTS